MKNVCLLITFLLTVLFLSSCQKELPFVSANLDESTPLLAQSVDEIMGQIKFDLITIKDGIPHFESLAQFKETIEVLEEADEVYRKKWVGQSNMLISEPITYDEFYIAKQFIKKIGLTKSFMFTKNESFSENGFFSSLPINIKTVLSTYGEVVLGETYIRLYDDGDYIELLSPTTKEIKKERATLRTYTKTFTLLSCTYTNTKQQTYNLGLCNNRTFIAKTFISIFNINAFNLHMVVGRVEIYSRGAFDLQYIPDNSFDLNVEVYGVIWKNNCVDAESFSKDTGGFVFTSTVAGATYSRFLSISHRYFIGTFIKGKFTIRQNGCGLNGNNDDFEFILTIS